MNRDLEIEKGRLFIYRLFDVADEIDLSLVEQKVKEATRIRPSKIPFSRALEFKNPPLGLELKPFTYKFKDREVFCFVVGKLFDFGVCSICFILTLDGLTLRELMEITISADRDEGLNSIAIDYARSLMMTFSETFVSPSLKETSFEDYMVSYIKAFQPRVEPEILLRDYPLANLLLMDPDVSLSEKTEEEALRYRFSYSKEDLAILHYDSAIVIDPKEGMDIADILEFASAQILELRYYDSILDAQLQWLYDELERQKEPSIFNLRAYRAILKKLLKIYTEVTEVTERVHNALKVTEDVYYSRIYRTAMAMFRSGDWEESIKNKLNILTNTYRMLSEELSTKREEMIELGILLLIVLEILLAVSFV